MDAVSNATPPHPDRRAAGRTDPVRDRHHDAIFMLARASELHDEDTGSHLQRMRVIVERIALRLGLDPDDAELLGYDAMLHDVGKLTVPASILTKPDALTAREWASLESHVTRGERLLAGHESMRRAARIARSHHEAWDGTGYPDGLRGEAIPLEARITAAADVLDALIAARAYKPRWNFEAAMAEVRRLAGSRLDPLVVAALEQCDLSDVFA
jgi:putative two-component system response regulator